MPLGSTRRPTRPKTRAKPPASSLPLPSAGARVLGVDPGLASTGWAVVEERDRRVVCLAAGTILTYSTWPLWRRVALLHDDLFRACQDHAVQRVRIEDYVAYAGKSGKVKRATSSVIGSGVGTGQAIAAAVLAGLAAGATVEEPVRAWDWHQALGIPGLSPKATSEERKALAARYIRAQVAGVPADASDHAVDAVGIAASAWLGRRQQGALELVGAKRRAPRSRGAPTSSGT